MSFETRIFSINFIILLETFLSGEKIEGEMVLLSEGSGVKGSPQQVGPLAVMSREGLTHNSKITEINGRCQVKTGGSVNDTTPVPS